MKVEEIVERLVVEAARKALSSTEFARTDVVSPVNGTAPYTYVAFHGERVTFHDGEFTIEMHRDAGTSKAAAYASKINDALLDLAQRAARGALEKSATALTDQAGRIERLVDALTMIGDGRAFRYQRFAEDDVAEYFLRCQREVQKFARSALLSEERG